MPTNLYEAPKFFKWALKKNLFKIYLHSVQEFKDVTNLDTIYWKNSLAPFEKEIKKILEENKQQIIATNKHYISMHPYFAEFSGVNQDFIEKNGFENIIKITS